MLAMDYGVIKSQQSQYKVNQQFFLKPFLKEVNRLNRWIFPTTLPERGEQTEQMIFFLDPSWERWTDWTDEFFLDSLWGRWTDWTDDFFLDLSWERWTYWTDENFLDSPWGRWIDWIDDFFLDSPWGRWTDWTDDFSQTFPERGEHTEQIIRLG